MDRLPNIHPGEVLREEFLVPMGISMEVLANAIHIPVLQIIEICSGERNITPNIAMRLSKAFGTTSAFWISLQSDYDMEEELLKNKHEIDKIQRIAASYLHAPA